MKDPKIEKSPIGYINPMFPVKIALAALGDGEKLVGIDIDIKGSVEDTLALFAHICDAVTNMLVGCCACESEEEKEETVTDTVSGIVATVLVRVFEKLEKEDEDNE